MGYNRFQIGCVFVEYDKPTTFIQNCIYEFSDNFDTVFHQFLETGTSDRTLMGLDQLLKCLGFSLYPLLIFPLQFEIWDLKGSHSCGIVLPSYFP